MSGGYRAYVTLLDNGFMVEAIPSDEDEPQDGVYNMFSTLQDSMENDQEDFSEEPGDLTRSHAAVGIDMLKKIGKIKRKRND